MVSYNLKKKIKFLNLFEKKKKEINGFVYQQILMYYARDMNDKWITDHLTTVQNIMPL